ncbi:hypothetical protein FO514_31805 [Bacillus cereus]|nr:hypothetical protein [Bacillus cereus]
MAIYTCTYAFSHQPVSIILLSRHLPCSQTPPQHSAKAKKYGGIRLHVTPPLIKVSLDITNVDEI